MLTFIGPKIKRPLHGNGYHNDSDCEYDEHEISDDEEDLNNNQMLLSNYKSSDNVSNPSERSRFFFDCLRLRRNYKRNRKKAFSKKGQFYTRHHHKNIVSNFILHTLQQHLLIHINPSPSFFASTRERIDSLKIMLKQLTVDFTLCRLLYTLMIIIALKEYLVTFVKSATRHNENFILAVCKEEVY